MREEDHFGAFGHHSCGALTLSPAASYQNHTIMSKVFDPGKPEEYIKSFNIRKT